MDKVIHVDNLCKTFRVKKATTGITGALKSIFHSASQDVHAIKQLSFEVKAGERVAFIGPNGAGKSTTIKMLTGILYPSSGFVSVLGLIPWKDRNDLGYKIGTVFGQRTQLWYHLPALDTFDLLSKIYEIEPAAYRKRLKELIEVFSIETIQHKPVSQLSLGERMRCETVASLIHNPQILFLDEPTIGLDINAKLVIRNLLNRLSKEYGTTLFLTSHDTADIEQVCERVLVLDKGSLIMDSSIKELKKAYAKRKIISLVTDAEKLSLNLPGMEVINNANYHFVCEVNTEENSIDNVIQQAIQKTSLKDVTIENPSMEEVIRNLYAKEVIP